MKENEAKNLVKKNFDEIPFLGRKIPQYKIFALL